MKTVEARVAWVTLRLGRNGNLLYMGPLLKGISEACNEFRVFTVEFGGDCNSADIDITCMGSIKQINQDVTNDGVPTAIPLVSTAIIKALRRYKPDLLILNEFGMLTMYGILLSLISKRTKILLLVENRPVKVGSAMSRKVRRLIRRLIASRADALLTNNSDGQNYLTQDLGVDKARIVSRPYLISDMSNHAVNTANLTKDDKRIHFIFVGRLIQLKGLHHALEAFALLKSTHPGTFVFDIVGDGEYRSTLEHKTEILGLQDCVLFHGPQPYDELAGRYHHADVFLFPTLMDYRSLVCFEAMSTGLPIMASVYDGGSIETVQHGENGYTFDPLDHQNLSTLMSHFIERPTLLQQFSDKSKEMSHAYSLDRAIESVTIASNLALKSVQG